MVATLVETMKKLTVHLKVRHCAVATARNLETSSDRLLVMQRETHSVKGLVHPNELHSVWHLVWYSALR